MMTGIMCLILNWNPLIKLDGYYMLADIVGISNLKEDSTAYASAWVKKHVWRLPVEVPYIPKRRRFGFVAYALISGVYSYSILYIVARFAGNFVRNFSPEWGFIPELGVAGVIFRSRIRLLVNFMKFLYLDKKDRVLAFFTLRNSAIAAGILALLLGVPVWNESVVGKFVLEPANQVVVRAHVPGTISKIFVREGEPVLQGSLLATLSNTPLQSELGDARAKLLLASDKANMAARNYQDYGNALSEKELMAKQYGQVTAMNAALELNAPITGTVVTPKVQDLLGAYLKPGSELLQIADLTQMRARIYISEYELYKVRAGERAKLQLDGMMRRREGRVSLLSVRPTETPQAELAEAEAKERRPQQFYFVDIIVQNPAHALKPGMTGVARVYGSRRSIGGMGLEEIRNFWGRKLW
jgi:putative peptide zinc metalloprotease protein